MMRKITPGFVGCMLISALVLLIRCSCAQTVSPIIVEYKGKAEGKIALTNNTHIPMAVILEPRSFRITPDGNGVYRSLDPGIHVELSSMSFRIDPGQTHYVFYKANAETLPAWFTIYSTFSAIKQAPDLDIRLLLPHTVYIYPKKAKSKDDVVKVEQAAYSKDTGKVVCELTNDTVNLERVEKVSVTSSSRSITSSGFPLLPGSKRRVEVDWKETDPPRDIVLHMDRATIKLRLSTDN